MTAFGLCKFREIDEFAQFQDLMRAVRPIMFPADNQIAASFGVAMAAVIAAFIFKFNEDALPAEAIDAAHGFAIRKAILDVHDYETQAFGHGAEQVDDAGFIYGAVGQLARVHHRPVNATIKEQPGFPGVTQKRTITWVVVGGDDFEDVAPLAGAALFLRVLTKGAANLMPAAKTAAQGTLTVPAEFTQLLHGGQVVNLSGNLGPLAEQIGQRRLVPLARGLNIAHLQGAVEAPEMLLDKIAADAGHVTEFS